MIDIKEFFKGVFGVLIIIWILFMSGYFFGTGFWMAHEDVIEKAPPKQGL